jgi:aminopeptidase N
MPQIIDLDKRCTAELKSDMGSRWTSLLAATAGIVIIVSWLAIVSGPARRAFPMRGTSPEPGISAALAAARASMIDELRYQLAFDIPSDIKDPVRGREVIRFALREIPESLILDFAPTGGAVSSLRVDGSVTPYQITGGHIVIPASRMQVGDNEIEIEFIAGNEALNRNPEYLYSLFVPARAHLAFPCFDQPDLKARFSLTLSVPTAWDVVANGAELERHTEGERTSVLFAETQPLPTYLFAFVAGRFQIEHAERDGRLFRMLHRETDAAKLTRNRDTIFDLHARALQWMEEYTTIPYMFGKFDFVLVPSFQFSGMEHAGAVLYNASSLLLDDTATKDQELARASTISHEAAHMWFGDLVTMQWFDDVWMKEVFANFFAAKIVNPSFPELNHDLRFLMAHHPGAYEVDRTAGANPIRQRLENLREAGSLYGAIIYQKAPIVMRQLEALMGEAALRDGLREYLERHGFDNATWPDLIGLLDSRTEEDLATWSRTWVEEAARPTVTVELETDAGLVRALRFAQSDPWRRGLVWNQPLQVVLGYDNDLKKLPIKLDGPLVSVPEAVGLPVPRFVLPSGGELGYGRFVLDASSRRTLLAELPGVPDALVRGSAWVILWDEVLERHIAPQDFLESGLRALVTETDELNIQRILAYLGSTYWRLLSSDARRAVTPGLESALRDGLAGSRTTSLKAAYFSTLRHVASSTETVGFLERVWRRQELVPGLMLSETDESALAMELAVREVPAWSEILQTQLERIGNPDRRDRFAFVMPALSASVGTRDGFFASLTDANNRRHEPWVLEGVSYLHHPLRAAESERYIRPSLELLEDIQRTGDIFFPKRWLDATLSNHHSQNAATMVREFLDRPADYPPRLRQIILQSADSLFRANTILTGR